MGRIRREIIVAESPRWTVFDSGARKTYVTRETAEDCVLQPVPRLTEALFGGQRHQIDHTCILFGEIDGHYFDTQACVVDQIGADESGRQIDVLFGTLAMQLYSIHLDMLNERLDLTHDTTEFIEF